MSPEQFHIETPVFQGPLEALLNLIEERKLSISQISLAEVCDAYLAHVENLPELPLKETSQFILVASTLLLVKSRTLLPSFALSEEEKESVEELERRLARYALIRKSSAKLKREWGRAPLVLASRAPAQESVFVPGETTLETIVEAMRNLVHLLPKPEKIAQAMVAPVLALEDAVTHLKERVTSAFKARFSELTRSKSKLDTIVYFLATLELVRSGSISATQEKLFEDIVLASESSELPKYGV